jgi:hypothetical protein
MKSDSEFPRRHSSGAALVLTAAAAIAGIVIPPLLLVRRRAWGLALVLGILWLGALYVFFAHYAGPGFLAHVALWCLALAGLCAPRALARLEAKVRRLAGQRPPADPSIAA